ncbi:MAG: HAD family hydrolase, partial [Phenylobacterium sp.]
MAKAVIWDVGNVIVRWSPRTLYSKIFEDSDECDRFLSDVCTMDWHGPTDCGVTFAENCSALSARFPEHHDAIWAWTRRWGEMFSGAIPETEAAIEALHARGVKQYALTNMSHETEEQTFAMSPAFGLLDG